MKKLFTTIFLFFYLISSFGVASVQHYCHMMQKSMEISETSCCCTAESELCSMPEPENSSCCADEKPAPQVDPQQMVLTALHIECCDTHHSFHQIETSPVSQNFTMDSDVVALGYDTIELTASNHFSDSQNSIQHSDPALHLNLPLLI